MTIKQNNVMGRKLPIENALKVAKENLRRIRTVKDWAESMGYSCTKDFSRRMRNYYKMRPSKSLISLKSIIAIKLLSETEKTVYEIGYCRLGIGDEKKFWQFMRYHTGYSPTEVRAMKKVEVNRLYQKIKGGDDSNGYQ